MEEQLYPHLFSPIKVRETTIPNRIVMAPMESFLGDEGGFVTAAEIAYYKARAEGGTGMIIVEPSCVDRPSGILSSHQNCLDSPQYLDGHHRLVEAITSSGSVACLQLQHCGLQALDKSLLRDGIAVGPSNVYLPAEPRRLDARALSHSEIEDLIECFGRSAELAIQAGYQAIELHGAHGYLLSSFLSPVSNQRQDNWGGDEERRLNFPLRVIQRLREAIGNRPLLYRFSAVEFVIDGLSIEDSERIAPKLVAVGVDVLHVSTGVSSVSMDKVCEPISTPEGWRIQYASRIRKVAKVPVVTVGQIRQPRMAEEAIREGDADFVALGRALLADPEWANKAKRGAEESIRPCISCNKCLASLPNLICAVNPGTCRELQQPPASARVLGQRAIVIGGGPGGMVAALMLKQAGYRTELYERRATLGGGLIASSAVHYKGAIERYRRYLECQLHECGIVVKLNTNADLSTISEVNPAIVVLAAGASVISHPIEGSEHDIVRDAYDVLMGDNSWQPKNNALPIVVYGGGETGCETAEYLTERNYQVILVTRSPASDLARSAEVIYREVFRKRLAENSKIRIVDNTRILSVCQDGTVILESRDGKRSDLKASRVMIAQGRKPDAHLAEMLAKAKIPFVLVGDAKESGRIGDAVHDAYAAMMCLSAAAITTHQFTC